MSPPTVSHEDILGNSCNADFAHIKHLYAIEEDIALKIAHKLKKGGSESQQHCENFSSACSR